jgi:hypothetical protein
MTNKDLISNEVYSPKQSRLNETLSLTNRAKFGNDKSMMYAEAVYKQDRLPSIYEVKASSDTSGRSIQVKLQRNNEINATDACQTRARMVVKPLKSLHVRLTSIFKLSCRKAKDKQLEISTPPEFCQWTNEVMKAQSRWAKLRGKCRSYAFSDVDRSRKGKLRLKPLNRYNVETVYTLGHARQQSSWLGFAAVGFVAVVLTFVVLTLSEVQTEEQKTQAFTLLGLLFGGIAMMFPICGSSKVAKPSVWTCLRQTSKFIPLVMAGNWGAALELLMGLGAALIQCFGLIWFELSLRPVRMFTITKVGNEMQKTKEVVARGTRALSNVQRPLYQQAVAALRQQQLDNRRIFLPNFVRSEDAIPDAEQRSRRFNHVRNLTVICRGPLTREQQKLVIQLPAGLDGLIAREMMARDPSIKLLLNDAVKSFKTDRAMYFALSSHLKLTELCTLLPALQRQLKRCSL